MSANRPHRLERRQPAGKLFWIGGCAALAVVYCLSTAATADTVAHWDFESDLDGSAADGVAVSHPGADGEFNAGIPDLSGNDNHLSTFLPDTMNFSSLVSPNNLTGSTLSTQNVGTASSGFRTDGDLNVDGNPIGGMSQFTFEASVRLTDAGGWQTLVGRDAFMETTEENTAYLDLADGNTGDGGTDANQSSLYFQKTGDFNTFRINFISDDGSAYLMDGTTVPVVDRWYNVAATSDGQYLRLYVDGFLEKEMDMLDRNGGTGSTVLDPLDESGMTTDDVPTPYSWAVARGFYNGSGRVDPVLGNIDDVRISDAALDPQDFLNGPLQLSLVINTTDGEVRIRNDGDGPFSMDYYQIDSPTSGALLTGDWDSLSDQDYAEVDGGDDPGETWTEVGGTDENLLAEQFLLGESTISPGGQISLGNIYSTAIGGEDLEFRFSGKADGNNLLRSQVLYVDEFPQGVEGDYNDDGIVNAADYVLWRNGGPLLNDPTPGVQPEDYDFWVSRFGNTAGSGGGSTAVPEPTAATLAWVVAAGMLACCRRCRRLEPGQAEV